MEREKLEVVIKSALRRAESSDKNAIVKIVVKKIILNPFKIKIKVQLLFLFFKD